MSYEFECRRCGRVISYPSWLSLSEAREEHKSQCDSVFEVFEDEDEEEQITDQEQD